MKTWLKGCLIALAAFIILLIIGGVVGYNLMFQSSPPATPTSPPQPSGPPLPQGPLGPPGPPAPPPLSPSQTLDQKIQQLQKEIAEAQAAGEHRKVTITITQDEINAKVAETLPQAKMPGGIQVKKLTLNLVPDKIIADVDLDYNGKTMSVKAEAHIEIRSGVPVVLVDKVSMGLLPVPGPLKSIANDFMNQMISSNITKFPITIERIIIEQGKITAEGTTK